MKNYAINTIPRKHDINEFEQYAYNQEHKLISKSIRTYIVEQIPQIKNDFKFLGIFSNEYDYSAIIQINNKICGIYKVKNNFNNHFSLWEIDHDFNDEKIFDINKFKLLGEIKNVYFKSKYS